MRSTRRIHMIVASTALLLFLSAPAAANANLVDRVKEWVQLPAEVNGMKQQVDDAVRRSEEASRELRALAEENRQLQMTNAALRDRLDAAERELARKESSARRWTHMAIAASVLAIGYVAASRLMRLAVWRRQKESEHA